MWTSCPLVAEPDAASRYSGSVRRCRPNEPTPPATARRSSPRPRSCSGPAIRRPSRWRTSPAPRGSAARRSTAATPTSAPSRPPCSTSTSGTCRSGCCRGDTAAGPGRTAGRPARGVLPGDGGAAGTLRAPRPRRRDRQRPLRDRRVRVLARARPRPGHGGRRAGAGAARRRPPRAAGVGALPAPTPRPGPHARADRRSTGVARGPHASWAVRGAVAKGSNKIVSGWVDVTGGGRPAVGGCSPPATARRAARSRRRGSRRARPH